MAGLITIKIILILFSFYINTVSSVVVNTTQFDNFTILWEDFSLLQCATPTIINISLFYCLPPPASQIVDDMSCLSETTIDFDQTTCQATSTAVMYTSSIQQTTQKVTTIPSTTITIQTSTSTVAATTTQSTTTTTTTTTKTTSTLTTSTSTSTASTTSSTTTSSSTTIGITSTPSNIITGATSMVTTTTTVTQAADTSTPAISSTTSTSTTSSTTSYTSAAVMTSAYNNINTEITTTTTTVAVTSYSNVNPTAITTDSSGNNITTTTGVTTTTTANIYTCLVDEYIGTFCNVSSDPCAMSQPCLNSANCIPTNTSQYGFDCQCQSGYHGDNCEIDERSCTEHTCWHNGTCIPMNATVSSTNGSNFKCECVEGYNGVHCELKIDLCGNITCENKGMCYTIELMWKCICLDTSLYYGDYCQFKTGKLKLREILSKSFASIAIAAIVTTCTFIIIMDVLKYAFHIDPVEYERDSYRKRREERRRARQPVKNTEPKLALRFQYVS